ncbi:carboxymuconolactone decarboxylase family protein [Aestuariicella hydrocarbonica]|uniref:Carboxymuconolactone decarboxylase family protein n=1 Tax=Pseudomaricurvus hydrocarbonicus TaxID=1470433 RepID=A0A9E5ML43_9GAMM|nr:carboxymuconolactone decarboxylase family protein [Aestuariicella hydrocarbonica]NHO66367.1 carboxymuconolactone decarboxylase family protein [Aestuariicella hydrocarbonica]
MKCRLPEFDQKNATDEQEAVLKKILNGPRGNLDGPFLTWIHSPELAQQAQELGAFCRYQTGLSIKQSELAILCTAAQWRSQAEWYIHYPIALQAGLDADLLEQIRIGEKPSFKQEGEAIIWRIVNEIYHQKRLSDSTYHKAKSLFGTKVLVNLVGLLGYYSMVAITLNFFNVRAQGQNILPFSE